MKNLKYMCSHVAMIRSGKVDPVRKVEKRRVHKESVCRRKNFTFFIKGVTLDEKS